MKLYEELPDDGSSVCIVRVHSSAEVSILKPPVPVRGSMTARAPPPSPTYNVSRLVC